LSALKIPQPVTKKTEVLAKHLRETIGKNSDVAVHVLRTWLKGEGA
jgi:flagellar biosynthesis/type III secretory pathway M-ring protein FliF/YscJ